MSNNPLISVITVAYNSAATIEDTIKSVLNQSYKNVEYIIIDGKSKDETVDIIKKYEPCFAEKNMTYRWISEPDTGIYNAMNKGVKLAAGELIGLVNSDDYYRQDALAHIAAVYERTGADMIHGNIEYINKYGEFDVFTPEFKKGDDGRYVEDYSIMNKRMNIKHPATFIKKAVYEKYGYYDESFRIAADYDYLLKLVKSGIKISYTDHVISTMRYGGISCNYAANRKEVCRVHVKNGGNPFLLRSILFVDVEFYRFKQFIKRVIRYRSC